MRYFLDTEFIEDGTTIDLISIGVVAQDGREYYAVSKEFRPEKASDWVLENVLRPMGLSRTGWEVTPDLLSPTQKQHYLSQRSRSQIADDLVAFCKPGPIEFWGHYSDYDWVVVAQLFGSMADLPRHFPQCCFDLHQWASQCNILHLPISPPEIEHHALHDARWVKCGWDFLDEYGDL